MLRLMRIQINVHNIMASIIILCYCAIFKRIFMVSLFLDCLKQIIQFLINKKYLII